GGNLAEIDIVQRQTAGLQLLVVTGNAVFIQDCAVLGVGGCASGGEQQKGGHGAPNQHANQEFTAIACKTTALVISAHFANVDGRFQTEIEQGFGGDSDVMAPGGSLSPGSCSAAGQCSNSGPFAAACHCSDDGSKQRATARELSRALVGAHAFLALLHEITGFEPIAA